VYPKNQSWFKPEHTTKGEKKILDNEAQHKKSSPEILDIEQK
jgi:hypothetical protein